MENVTQTNTAVTYLDLEKEPVSSGANCEIPSYLTTPAPTTLMIEDLRKHVMVSDIEKNRALTRMANKVILLVPTLHKVLRQLDCSVDDNTSDHSYQAQE